MLPEIYRALAEELIAQRELLGVSQQKLARAIGSTKRTIGKHEKTHYRKASLETLIKVAEALENYRRETIALRPPQ